MYKKTYSSSDVIKSLNIYHKVRSFRKAAQISGVSKSTICRWWNSLHCLRKRQRLQRKKKNRKPKYKNLEESIKNLFSSDSLKFFTLQEVREKLETKPSLSTIHRVLKNSKISRRKFETTKVCLKSKEEIKERYRDFDEQLKKLQDNEIVCVDETYLCNIGNPSYGYFKKGKHPIINSVPKRKRYSIIVTISSSKVISIKKQDKPFTKETFNKYIIESVIPVLDPSVKALLMDNVAFHKNRQLQEELSNRGISCLFIPPYSPRCNPIEEVFSVMKRRFRKLDNNLTFESKVERIIDDVKLYKDIVCYYTHTRKDVKCQISES